MARAPATLTRKAPAHRIRSERTSPVAEKSAVRSSLPPRSNIKCAVVAVVGAVVMCIRDHAVFTVPIHENTDYAANSILVNQAVHFDLLIGNYSREGFHHPGPAFLYLQSFGQDIFYSFLHVVPYQYNGQLIAVFILGSTMLALTARVLARHTGSWTIALVGLGVVLVLTGATLSWASAWMPYLYVAPFLLATVAGVSVAVGALEDLPLFAVALGLLVHGHIAFVGIMGIFTAAVVIGWLILQRGEGPYRLQIARAYRPLIATGIIAVLFVLPIVVNLVLHWPGQFSLYWHYIQSNPNKHAHSLNQVVSYVTQYWPGGGTGKALVLIAGIAATALALVEPDRGRRRFFLGLLTAVIVMTLVVGLYALRGVDDLSYVYTGYFYYTTPPLLVGVLIMEMCCRARGWVAGSWTSAGRRSGAAILAVLVAGALLVVAFTASSFGNSYRGDSNLPRMASAIATSPQRQGRGVAIVLDDPGTPYADWSDVVGLLIAASRSGYQPCVANPNWNFMMTTQYICTSSEARNRWRVKLYQTGWPSGAHGPVVFKDTSTVVYADST